MNKGLKVRDTVYTCVEKPYKTPHTKKMSVPFTIKTYVKVKCIVKYSQAKRESKPSFGSIGRTSAQICTNPKRLSFRHQIQPNSESETLSLAHIGETAAQNFITLLTLVKIVRHVMLFTKDVVVTRVPGRTDWSDRPC